MSRVTFEGKPNEKLLLEARTECNGNLEVDAEGCIAIPQDLRKRCEAMLESVANVYAVLYRTGRSLSSPTPTCAFSELKDDDRQRLEASQGIRAFSMKHYDVRYPFDLSDEKIVNTLWDRLEGVAIVAQSMSTNHAVGKYRDFILFFESAFARPATQLAKKVAQFLEPSKLGYTRKEVKGWFELRHGAVHADRVKSTHRVTEMDVRSLIPRMEQAVLDVLFNKESWHQFSQARRDVLRPLAATTATEGQLQIVNGSNVTIMAQCMDPFGVFPVDLHAFLNPGPMYWWRPCGPGKSDSELAKA